MRFSKYSKLTKKKAHPKRSTGIYKEKNLRIKLDIEKMYTLAHIHTHTQSEDIVIETERHFTSPKSAKKKRKFYQWNGKERNKVKAYGALPEY